jgi:hypothetical protein
MSTVPASPSNAPAMWFQRSRSPGISAEPKTMSSGQR